MNAPRPLYWSIRREVWENRSLYLAPLIASAVVLFAFLVRTLVNPARERSVANAYGMAAGMAIMVAGLAGVFYCLEALQGERRDRSILFWKSLPVSDRTTVLAKISIPLLVLPAVSFAIIITTQLLMLLLSSVILVMSGRSVAAMWERLPLFQMTGSLLYSLPIMALWYAPVYAWLLLISAWARRVAALWVVLPLVALQVLEIMVFGTKHIAAFLRDRLIGWFPLAFHPIGPGDYTLTPAKVLSTPGLWVGVALAWIFIAATVRLRRNREN